MTTANLTKVIVPCRLSYAHLWEPDSINGSEPKYSVSCIIDKEDKETIAKIKKAIEIAKDEGKGKWGGKIPANLKTPLRDGDIDRPEDEAYADSMFLNANSKQAPQIVDRQVQPILDQSEVYSGCYGRVSITFYAYNSNGNKGIAAGLGNVQKLRDGEPLGSRANAKDEFEAVDARIIDLASGQTMPDEIMECLMDDSVVKTAFNAAFERNCINRFFGLSLKPEGWRCTAVQASMLSLPLSLEGVGEALNLDKKKMSEGKDLIRYFCMPCKPTKANGGKAGSP